ncbi:MAG TPA: PAS domain-containing protein, partial [Sulfuricurvum sp.]|nr:PAS domain-containing protein [Sulfuricurvum sp.]
MQANNHSRPPKMERFIYQKWIAYLFFTISLTFIAFISYHFHLEHHITDQYDISLVIGVIGLIINLIFLALLLALINNRKLQQEQYFELDMLYTLINESNDMVFILRLDNGAIQYANQTALNVLGYTFDEIRSIGIEGFRRPIEPSEAFSEHLQELKKARRLTDYAILMRKDGSEFMIEANVRAMNYGGTDYNIAIVRDITENESYNQKIIHTSMMLKEAQKLAKLGSWQFNQITNTTEWSDEVYEILEFDREQCTPGYEAFLDAVH